MKLQLKLGLVLGVLALSASPALAAGPPSNPGTDHIPPNPGTDHIPTDPGGDQNPATPGPNASLPDKARAYGKYCEGESRKPVEGERGTPFSKCVTAMAKLANGRADNPREACKAESKKPVEGTRGSPFSKCVSGAAKLLKDLREEQTEGVA